MSKKSNFNIGSIIIIIILLQLGVRGFKEINKKFKMKKRSEALQLCMKETNDAFKCKNPLKKKDMPVWFKPLVDKVIKDQNKKKLTDPNTANKNK